MEIIYIIIVCFILYQVYRAWDYGKPHNTINRLELFIMQRDEEFINNKKKAIEDMEEGKDLFIKMSGQKRYEEIINELEEINKEKIKMNHLVVHLKEKYKYDPAKIITILVDYADWLYATGHYYANRIHIHYVEDADSIFEENNENFLKAITIKERLSKLADKDVLKLLATTQKK